VDIQAARSPLPLKQFCASHVLERAQPIHEDKELIEAAATDLVGEKPQKNVIVVGLRSCYGKENGAAITSLAEALNAPILTRLDAKGVVNEHHPLSFGVVGVHGKVGLQSAAALISSCDRVICIGVDEETLMVCNVAGLQIRRVIEIDTDAFGLTTRYNADHSLVGPIDKICQDLALAVETKTTIRNRKEKVSEILISFSKDCDSEEDELRELEKYDKFSYMAHGHPHAVHPEPDPSLPLYLQRFTSVPNVKDFQAKSEKLWRQFHNADWLRIAKSKSSIKYQTDLSVSRAGFAHPAAVLHAISHARSNPEMDQVMKDATICVDVGDCTLWASLSLTLQDGSRTLYSERLGTMGYSLCAGIASIMCRPSPAGSIVLAGDGGFQMSLQELSTFQQYKRNGDRLTVFVFDNKLLGRVAFGFDSALGCEFQSPDYVALAKSYGGNGVRLDDTAKAAEVVKQAFTAEGLFIVHVLVDPKVKADMANFTDNSMKHMMNSG
jgi:thiamine pyrophosphate-dependent acetolactate synthase large subunit-like protein